MGGDIHIRGTGILGPVKGLRVHRQRALELLPERLRGYLSQKIDVGDWYPFSDHLELLQTLIRILPFNGDSWEWMGQLTASFDLIEVYPFTVQPGDPPGTLLRLPEVWLLYHDAGELKVTLSNGCDASIELDGFAFTTDEYCRLLTGYFSEAVRLAGGDEVEMSCAERGESSARWTARWQPPLPITLRPSHR